jgi:hypothetical protein
MASNTMYVHASTTTEEGMRDAYSSITRELGAAAHRIVAVPLDQYQKHGATGYLSSLASGILRLSHFTRLHTRSPHAHALSLANVWLICAGVPLAILRPIIGVTEGMTKTLIGVQRWVDPALEDEIATKFKKKPKRPSTHRQYQNRRQPGDANPRTLVESDDSDDDDSRSIDNEEGDTLASQVGGAFYYGASMLGSALPGFGGGPAALPGSLGSSSSSSSASSSAFTRRYVPDDDNFSDDDSEDDSDI